MKPYFEYLWLKYILWFYFYFLNNTCNKTKLYRLFILLFTMSHYIIIFPNRTRNSQLNSIHIQQRNCPLQVNLPVFQSSKLHCVIRFSRKMSHCLFYNEQTLIFIAISLIFRITRLQEKQEKSQISALL